MDEELKLRINELAKKKKFEGLTKDEQAEQASLYRMYIDELKDQLKTSLDQAGIKPKG
ncbi:MAG: DUF896 domain-containing protein [Syntrophomonadaceae bacterium]|jgi:uncharacterized protein YnzC (UPF0291/DUF896 family)|nr:DUF896 domain-containing protein [Syntrophomonadaceae bacterium]